ncbi:hypothetical protein ARSEF4850_001777 [Beauveria asiatica]
MCLTQKSADVVVMDISHKIRKQPFVMRFNKLEHTLGTTKVFNLVQVDDSDEVPLPVNVVRIYSHHEVDDIKRMTDRDSAITCEKLVKGSVAELRM